MKVMSLFCGAGGLSLGFIQAGHQVVWANDNDKDAVETYKHNIGHHVTLGDIKNIEEKDLPSVDIIVAGFPCQGFSVANTSKKENDDRNSLYKEIVRILKHIKPPFFLLENVKGLLGYMNGKFLDQILSEFNNANYSVQYKVLNAADYGVPQNRERVIFIGKRQDLSINITYPEPTHSKNGMDDLKKWVTIGDALKNIPEPGNNNDISNHEYSRYKLRFNGYLGHRKVDPDKPSPTLTARGDKKGGVVIIHHPNNHRRLSVREAATIQSFPLDFNFYGSRTECYRQVANAVPPALAKAIAEKFNLNRLNSKG